MIASVPLKQAYKLLNHGPTVLVSTASGIRRNVMAAAWNMPLDFDPARVAIVIDKKTYTRELIAASGSFAINIPCVAIASIVVKLGSSSGRELAQQPDENTKFSAFDVPTFAGQRIEAPLVSGCVGWLECQVIPELHMQEAYDLIVAEVIAAQADSRVFSEGRWHFEGYDELRTLHHVAGGFFFQPGTGIQAS